MQTIRNIAFTVIVAALFCCAILYQTADCLIPGFEASDKTYAEGRDLVKIGDMAETSFLNKSFQDKFEQLAADSIPCKDSSMLLNASLQRLPIALAAATFSYDLYPTYFSSDQLVSINANRIIPMPTARPKSKSKSMRRLDTWCSTLSSSAQRHKDVRFVVDVVTQVRQDDDNPSYKLVKSSKLINADWISDAWGKRLSDDIVFIVDDIDSFEEIQQEWFRTDHHWKLERSLDSYNRIGKELGWTPVHWSDDELITVRSEWNGSEARYGLDFDFSSSLEDMATDFSNLEYYALKKNARGDKISLGKREDFLAGTACSDEISQYSAYTDYYGNGHAWIENKNSSNDRTCLLVGDSMGYNIRRYIAQNYKTTITLFPGNGAVKKTLDWYIDQYHVDDVVVLTHAQSYDFIAEKSPVFLGSE